MTKISVRFWGVRGSVPSPITNAAIEDKLVHAVTQAVHARELPQGANEVRQWIRENLPFRHRATYGGNTTCVEMRVGGELIILDMGTGLREFGIGHLAETFKKGGLKGTIFQSHVHWDHVQGFPFWAQLYMPREKLDNAFSFYGGLDWNKSLLEVLRGQMAEPEFPVNLRELEKVGMLLTPGTTFDGMVVHVPAPDALATVTSRKLHHPQETYGTRVEYEGKIAAFATDHEPYAGNIPHRNLVALAKGADVFITDCQYTLDEYDGAGGKVQKHGWGHSFPEYIARVASEAGVKMVVTTHHDPQASDERIEEIARAVEKLSGITTVPAYEGLTIEL